MDKNQAYMRVCDRCGKKKYAASFDYDIHWGGHYDPVCKKCRLEEFKEKEAKAKHIPTLEEIEDKRQEIRERWVGYPYLVKGE